MSCTKKGHLNLIAAACMLVMAPAMSHANVVYSYVSAPFTVFPIGTAYSGADSISFSFEVAEPLPANLFLSSGGVSVLNWTYSDGLQSGSSTDPLWSSLDYVFETNISGDFIGWAFAAGSATGLFQIRNFSTFFSGNQDFAAIFNVASARVDYGCTRCPSVPTWTITQTTPVPEPGAWALSALGLAMLGALRRRRMMYAVKMRCVLDRD